MPSVGDELRRERELRGIHLEEIAEETKIPIRFLEAIDSNQMETIPGEFYRCSMIRAYARYIGVDEDRMVSTYRFRMSAGSFGPQLTRPESVDPGRPPGATASFFARPVAWIILGAVGLGGAAVAMWSGGVGNEERRPPPPVPMAAPERLMREPVVAEPATVGSPPVVQEAREPRAGDELPLRLVLRVDEPCWLEIRADGTVAAHGLMLQGFQKEIRAQEEIRLWLGNAGGVTYWLNDQQGKPLGRAGQVKKDVRVTPDNVGEFVRPGTEPRPQSGSTGRRRPIEVNGFSG